MPHVQDEAESIDATNWESLHFEGDAMTKKQPILYGSTKKLFRLLVDSLKAEKLKFTVEQGQTRVLIRMSGNVQPFTVVAQLSDRLLLFFIPAYIRVPKNVEEQHRINLMTRILHLNDSIAIIKFSMNKESNIINLSVEVPWRVLGLSQDAILEYFRLLVSVAHSSQPELLTALLKGI